MKTRLQAALATARAIGGALLGGGTFAGLVIVMGWALAGWPTDEASRASFLLTVLSLACIGIVLVGAVMLYRTYRKAP